MRHQSNPGMPFEVWLVIATVVGSLAVAAMRIAAGA
jgi:hypothetical protein